MTPEEKERSSYIHHLAVVFMDMAMAHKAQVIHDEIRKICLKNQAAVGAKTNTFMYKGKMYSAGDPIKRKSRGEEHPNHKLHIDFRPQLEELLYNTDFQDEVDKSVLKTLFASLFLESKHVSDLYALLPSKMHDTVSDVKREIYNIGDAMSPAQLDQFKASNNSGLHLLNKIYLRQLLTNI